MLSLLNIQLETVNIEQAYYSCIICDKSKEADYASEISTSKLSGNMRVWESPQGGEQCLQKNI